MASDSAGRAEGHPHFLAPVSQHGGWEGGGKEGMKGKAGQSGECLKAGKGMVAAPPDIVSQRHQNPIPLPTLDPPSWAHYIL